MLSDRLKKTREEKGLSQTFIAEKIGITRQAYNHYETGKRVPPNDVLIKIAQILDCSTDYLNELSNIPKPKSLDEELDGISFALYKGAQELSDDDKKDVLNYLEFVKQRKKNDK